MAGCSCGCGEMTVVTNASEECACGCACCESEPKTHDQEIRELLTLKATIEKRLASLTSSGPRSGIQN